MRKNRAFTLIELLAVIIVLSIIMVLTIPNVIKSMNKAKDKAMIVYAKKLSKAANEYAILHQDEFKNKTKITKRISDVMGTNDGFSGTVTIYKDGSSTYSISSIERSLCNKSSNTSLDIDDITRDTCPEEDVDKQALTDFASSALTAARDYVTTMTNNNKIVIYPKYGYALLTFDEIGISVPNGYTGTILAYSKDQFEDSDVANGEPSEYFAAHPNEDVAYYVSVTDDKNYICFASPDNVDNKASTSRGTCNDADYGKEEYIY